MDNINSKETAKEWQRNSMKTALVLFILTFSSFSYASEKNWYEYPGIALGGVGYGALVGPENVAIREAHARAIKNRKMEYSDDFIPSYVLGTILHIGTCIALAIAAPPIGYAYLGMSSFLGSAQFIKKGGWDVDEMP